jgi:hypothetical protein
MPDKIRNRDLDKRLAPLTKLEGVPLFRALDREVLRLVAEGIDWENQVAEMCPDYFRWPYGFGYKLHSDYLLGRAKEYDKIVNLREQIKTIDLPENVPNLDGGFLKQLREAVLSEPTLEFKANLAPGSKTWRTALGNRGLIKTNHPAIAAYLSWLKIVISEYITNIEIHGDHPLASYKGNRFHIASLFAVVAEKVSDEIPHIHRDGMITGVLYLQVPEEIAKGSKENKEGWLIIGESLVDRQPPEKRIASLRPIEGRLIVFPAYIPHRINNFESDGRGRINLVFNACDEFFYKCFSR